MRHWPCEHLDSIEGATNKCKPTGRPRGTPPRRRIPSSQALGTENSIFRQISHASQARSLVEQVLAIRENIRPAIIGPAASGGSMPKLRRIYIYIYFNTYTVHMTRDRCVHFIYSNDCCVTTEFRQYNLGIVAMTQFLQKNIKLKSGNVPLQIILPQCFKCHANSGNYFSFHYNRLHASQHLVTSLLQVKTQNFIERNSYLYCILVYLFLNISLLFSNKNA